MNIIFLRNKCLVMKIFRIFLLFSTAAIFCNCSGADSKGDDEPSVSLPEQEVSDVIEVPLISDLEFNAREAKTNENINEFGLNFFKNAYQLYNKENENFIVSPVNATLGLAMLAAGADDTFRSKVVEAVGCEDMEALNSTARRLMMYLPNKEHGCELTLANNVWHHLSLKPREDFYATMRDYYFSDVKSLDFLDSGSADVINDWCKAHTNNVIPRFISHQQLRNFKVFEIAALYFSADWSRKFDVAETVDGDFTTASGRKCKAMFMNQSGRKCYFCNDFGEWVFVPYGDMTYSMILALPSEDVSVSDFISEMKSEWFVHNNPVMSLPVVDLSLPKFRFSREIMCSGVFHQMGIDTSTSFENLIIGDSDGKTDLLIKHIADISVSEESTVAAAVTGSGWKTAGGGKIEPEYVRFNLDRPFVFLVKNMVSGTIVFAGVVNTL